MEFSNEIKTFLKSLHPAGKTVGSADLVAKCHLIVTMNKAAWQRGVQGNIQAMIGLQDWAFNLFHASCLHLDGKCVNHRLQCHDKLYA